MIQRILAAVDSTPRAPGVLAVATELAVRFDARVFLFRAIEPPEDFPAAAANAPDPLLPEFQAKALEDLRTLADGDARIVVAPPRISHLEPWHTILEAAKSLDVDLIVIGSHGYGGWDLVLGTTAAKVVNHADRNVLVVRERPSR